MKNRNFRTLKNLGQRQAGYTLVELAITVSIIAVLIVGTLTGVQRLLRSNNANNTLTQTQVAVTNIARVVATGTKSVYGTSALDGTSVLAALGVWDSSAVTDTNGVKTVVSPFAGNITVSPNAAQIGTGANSALANTGYWYRIAGVPEDICPALASSFVSTAAGIYVENAAPASANLSGTPVLASAYKTPGVKALDTAQLAKTCAGNASGTVQIALFILT